MNTTNTVQTEMEKPPVQEEHNANGWFRLAIPEDGSHVYVKKFSRHSGNGKAVTIQDFQKKLKQLKIVHGINQDAIKNLLESVEQHQIPEEPVAIASGDAVSGQNGSIEWLINGVEKNQQRRFVVPGTQIAILNRGVQGKAGKNVYGKPVKPRPIFDPILNNGDGVILIEGENGEFIFEAETIGELIYEDDKISVNSHLVIAEDSISAHMHIPYGTIEETGYKFTLEDILAILEAAGIKHGINEDNITAALETTKEPYGFVENVLVAQGKAVKHGVNAELVIDHEQSIGKLLDNGAIDYNEKSYPWNVKANDVIGHVIPPEKEEDGINILGKVLKAKPAKKITLKLEDVERMADGTLRAMRDGVMLFNKRSLKVSDSLVMNGNVCQQTGNIHADKTVVVKGYVEPGFVLESKGDVIISENVEDATVQAEGSVVIKSGVRGSHSEIEAKENITVQFAENAKLTADGDITVNNSLICSETRSQQRIFIGNGPSSKSSIVGGITQAAKGVESSNLGSDSRAKTIIQAGAGPELIKDVNEATEELRTKKKNLSDLNRVYDNLRKQPKQGKPELLQKVNNTRLSTTKECEELSKKHEELQEKLNEAKEAKVVVHKNAYPGVCIQILDKTYLVKETRTSGTFRLDKEHIIFDATKPESLK